MTRPPRAALLAAVLAASPASAQIAVQTLGGSTCASCDVLTYPMTVSAAADQVLLVAITNGCLISNATDAALAVTYAGQPLTFYARTPCGTSCLIEGQNAENVMIEHWYLVSPPPGTDTVSITVPNVSCGMGQHYLLSGAVALSGVDQASPFRTSAGTTNTVVAPDAGACCWETQVTVASQPTDLVIDEVCSGSALEQQDPAATPLWLVNANGAYVCDDHGASALAATGSSTTLGWSAVQDHWIEQAVTVVAAPADAGGAPDAGSGGKLSVGCTCATASAFPVLALLALLNPSNRRRR